MGLSLQDLDELTLHEFGLYIEEYNSQLLEKQRQRTQDIWLTVALNRLNHSGETLPTLEELLNPKKIETEQTVDTMIDVLKSITLGSGGKVEVIE